MNEDGSPRSGRRAPAALLGLAVAGLLAGALAAGCTSPEDQEQQMSSSSGASCGGKDGCNAKGGCSGKDGCQGR